jgi:hypothetical protein
MTFIVRKPNGEIKTFMETANGMTLDKDETLETVELSFADYARRLQLSISGRSCETVVKPAGSPDVTVDVSCPGKTSVDLMVNDLKETVTLIDGKGTVTLSCAVAGLYLIQPADKKEYFAGGEAMAVVEVI